MFATMRETRRFLPATAFAFGALALAACGDTSEDAAPDRSAKAALSADTQAAIESAYTGTSVKPPTTSPKPEPGKNIWFVTLSANYGTPDELVAAGKLMDWRVKVFDGEFTPDTVVTGLRQAVADKADGVIVGYADCATIKAGLQDVEKAGIPVVNVESTDCNQEISDDGIIGETGQPGLFDSGVGYVNPDDPDRPLTFPELWNVFTTYQALGLIDGTQGQAKIIALSETDLRLNFSGLRAFKDTLEAHCPACEIVEEVEFVGTDYGSGLQQKVAQALVKHPEANALYGMFDTPTADAATAIMGSGRANEIFVMGGEGTAPVVDLIREGRGVNAGAGFSVVWEYWAALDAMNRLLSGETLPAGQSFPSGNGVQLFTKDRNLPPEGERFNGPIDFKAAYREAWGVG
jgi:ribose transport system substrate-binding protein